MCVYVCMYVPVYMLAFFAPTHTHVICATYAYPTPHFTPNTHTTTHTTPPQKNTQAPRIKAVLKGLPFLRSTPKDLLQLLLQHGQLVEYRPSEVIADAAQVDHMFVVVQGLVQIVYHMQGRTRVRGVGGWVLLGYDGGMGVL